MEAFQIVVNDKSIKVSSGTQWTTTHDNHDFPLNFKPELPYMNVRPYTDDELNTLPHVILASDDEWDPAIIGYNIYDDADEGNNDDWYDAIFDTSTKQNDPLFDSTGRYKHRHIIYGIDINIHNIDNGILPNSSLFYDIHEHDSYNTNTNNGAVTQLNT